ncbi:MAG: hypothetical protein PHQ42_00815 [Patescibacteria group bacterium]|nr:hypothetical protein [Patescibacteria group bacterium]
MFVFGFGVLVLEARLIKSHSLYGVLTSAGKIIPSLFCAPMVGNILNKARDKIKTNNKLVNLTNFSIPQIQFLARVLPEK